MAVTADATASGPLTINGGTGGTIGPGGTGTLIPTASATGMIGTLGFSYTGTAPASLTMTWNSVSMAIVSGTDSGPITQTSFINRSMLWQLGSPATGSHNLTVAWTNVSNAYLCGMSVAGGDTATPCKNGTTTNGSAATASITVNSPTGDLAIGNCTTDGGNLTVNQTQLYNDSTGSDGNGGGNYTAGSGASTSLTIGISSGSWVYSAADAQVPSAGDVLQPQIVM